MHGRRRETRLLPSSPWNAALETVEDVKLEKAGSGDVWVLGETPARRGDLLILEIAAGGFRIDVHVLESEPVLVDGGVRHRLKLRILAPKTSGLSGEPPREASERYGSEDSSH